MMRLSGISLVVQMVRKSAYNVGNVGSWAGKSLKERNGYPLYSCLRTYAQRSPGYSPWCPKQPYMIE